MRGDKVIVRSFGDRPLIRRVWCVQDGVVYICNERNFSKVLGSNISNVNCTGFPADDVFQYDETRVVDETKPAPPGFWEKLTKWQPGPYEQNCARPRRRRLLVNWCSACNCMLAVFQAY